MSRIVDAAIRGKMLFPCYIKVVKTASCYLPWFSRSHSDIWSTTPRSSLCNIA